MATKATTATASTTPIEPLLVVRLSGVVLLLLPGILIAWLGSIHLADGAAVDAAVPVPVYMVAQIRLPRAAYVEAARVLQNASPRNGAAALAEAEALLHAGASNEVVLPIVRHGLIYQPASARGWTLLAEMLTKTSPQQAASALSQALLLAPRDYWIAGARAQDGAVLWPYLDGDARSAAVDQARLLWLEPDLRPQLKSLVTTPEGAALVSRSFSQDDIRRINRWLAQEQRRGS